MIESTYWKNNKKGNLVLFFWNNVIPPRSSCWTVFRLCWGFWCGPTLCLQRSTTFCIDSRPTSNPRQVLQSGHRGISSGCLLAWEEKKKKTQQTRGTAEKPCPRTETCLSVCKWGRGLLPDKLRAHNSFLIHYKMLITYVLYKLRESGQG